MKEEAHRVEADVLVPPDVGVGLGAEELEPAAGVMIPCPDDLAEECDSAEHLNERVAGWVEDYLDAVSEAARSAAQENNLGCALAWLGDWAGAKEAFVRAERAKTGSHDDRERARANARVADGHLAA